MNPSTALATTLVDELVRQGVAHVVVCPGSRSAPLAYAVQEADRAGRLRMHVRVDERSAGFLALGLAKLSRVPAAVVTTSGTAVANLHPAVLEASHGVVPLILLTADRPPELRGTGANQTTDQPGLFGSGVRWTHDLGVPERRSGQVAAWRGAVSRATAAARGALGAVPGPVHLNVPLRDPLVPGLDADSTGGGWPEPLDGRPDGDPWTEVAAGAAVSHPGSRYYRSGIPTVNTSTRQSPRTLVVVGDLPEPAMRPRAVAWAAARGWPVIAEPFGRWSGDEVLPHGPLLLGCTEWLDRHAPDRVVVIGRVTLSRSVGALLRRPDVVVESVTAQPSWTDPSHVLRRVHPWSAIEQSAESIEAGVADSDWSDRWRTAAAEVTRTVAATTTWPSGAAVARALFGAVPDDAVVMLGSSAIVRDVDDAVPASSASAGERGVTVVANRGLAGIDGCLATAAGIALAGDGPTYALVGDLTFVHDTNALAIGPDEPRPDLTVVVVNDDGGGIFTTLEPGEPERADRFERIFGTPTGTDLVALCRAHGVDHVLATTDAELAGAVETRPHGIRVIEVRTDRAGRRAGGEELRTAVREVLSDSR